MNKLKQFGSTLRGSFWFLPTLIVAFSIALAVGLIEADSAGSRDWMADWPRLFGSGAAGGDHLAGLGRWLRANRGAIALANKLSAGRGPQTKAKGILC